MTDDGAGGLGDSDPLALPDLASRALRGSVIAASDEFFAEKENLILPGAPAFTPRTFGHKGQVYDGWETCRRRGPSGALPGTDEHDWVIVRLGAAGVVYAVIVDTAGRLHTKTGLMDELGKIKRVIERQATVDEVSHCIFFAGQYWKCPWITGGIIDCNGASYLRT